MAAMINCPYCGKLADPKLDNCPHCGGYLQKGGAPRGVGERKRRQTCPSCHALVQESDIICVACGTNLLTGQKVAQERAAAVQAGSRTPWLVGAAATLFVLLLAGIGYAMLTMSRDPVQRAMRLSADGKLLEATSLLENYVAKNTSNPAAYFELGKLQLATNQLPAAAASFETASQLDPNNADAALSAVVCLAAQKNEGTRDREIALLERLVKQNPQDARSWHLLALARGTKDDLPGQVEALGKALTLDSANVEMRLSLGIAEALGNNLAAAAQHLQQALQASPGNGDVLAALGTAASMKGDTAGASQTLADAIRGQTNVAAQAATRLALLLIGEGRFREAQEYLNQAGTGGASNPTVAFYRAVCLQAQGLTAEALLDFEALVQGGGPYAGRAALQSAQIYLGQGNADRARQALDRAQQLDADAAILNTLRGRVLSAAGDATQAQEAYKAAIVADPTYASAHLESGLLLVRRQVFSEGLRELERYLELVGPDRAGTRAEEIEQLVTQLKQTLTEEGEPSAQSLSTARREAS
ncbi:MAG: tetratricopeptide repeat protein [Candidatus Hydrogenedentes bacterium]|nr:tetratricopeptide repeat protein [Candidatus Hydrogenedentota bacterium]